MCPSAGHLDWNRHERVSRLHPSAPACRDTSRTSVTAVRRIAMLDRRHDRGRAPRVADVVRRDRRRAGRVGRRATPSRGVRPRSTSRWVEEVRTLSDLQALPGHRAPHASGELDAAGGPHRGSASRRAAGADRRQVRADEGAAAAVVQAALVGVPDQRRDRQAEQHGPDQRPGAARRGPSRVSTRIPSSRCPMRRAGGADEQRRSRRAARAAGRTGPAADLPQEARRR